MKDTNIIVVMTYPGDSQELVEFLDRQTLVNMPLCYPDKRVKPCMVAPEEALRLITEARLDKGADILVTETLFKDCPDADDGNLYRNAKLAEVECILYTYSDRRDVEGLVHEDYLSKIDGHRKLALVLDRVIRSL